MPFRDVDLQDIASADEMDDGHAYRSWLAVLDATIAPFTPDGYDASLDSEEWVIVDRAYKAKRDAKLIGMQIVHRRGWADDANDSLMVALRTSVALSSLEKRVDALAKQCDRIANFVQALPQREEHQAVVADIHTLQEQMRGLSLRRSA